MIDGKIEQENYDENGDSSPYKLTFVLKYNQDLKVNDAKADYKANQKSRVLQGEGKVLLDEIHDESIPAKFFEERFRYRQYRKRKDIRIGK